MSLFIDWLEIEQDFGIEVSEDLLLSIYGQYLMVVTEGGEIQKSRVTGSRHNHQVLAVEPPYCGAL
ncbi:hypothetical protein D3Z29_02190 [Rodentibacter pneumotropicus]|nr:hypothetical protein [Rodentibacter pneumotropicus]THA02968.1 hypothetical protein D3M73_11490 [Rodentibacter pneumotropicus]THA11540.1 hypothetical protein D3M81_08630 [Rodentibacter pneumotropicus]